MLYTIYIGLNDKETHEQIIDTMQARKIVENIFYDVISGATISLARGIYRHENGERIIENTIRAEVFDADYTDIVYIAEYLKKALNQESIAVCVTEVKSQFI